MSELVDTNKGGEVEDTNKGGEVATDASKIENFFKNIIIPTLEDLWSKFKINTKESLTSAETMYYTLQNWWVSFTNSNVYLVSSNTVYYLGGFALKNFIYEPVNFFFGRVIIGLPRWLWGATKVGYNEITDMLTKLRDWVIYPTMEGVIFLDKTMGSIFYIFLVPVAFVYKSYALVY